jgi:predicted ribosomally synthesized peptide with SipW-like signal peptide
MNLSMPFNKATRMRALTFGVLALGILSVQVGRGTLAYFTTQVKSDTNVFSAGNLHFNISDNDQVAVAGPVSSSIGLTNMKPGDSVYAPITVSNVGSLDGQYGISYVATGPGATDLTTHLKIAVVGAGDGVSAGITPTAIAECTGSNFATSSIWKEQILPVPEAMTNAGRSIVSSTSATGPVTDGAYVLADRTVAYLPLNHSGAVAFSSDLLCVLVTLPDVTPLSLTTEDNVFNSAVADTWASTIVFTFDGQQRHRGVEFDQPTVTTVGTP